MGLAAGAAGLAGTALASGLLGGKNKMHGGGGGGIGGMIQSALGGSSHGGGGTGGLAGMAGATLGGGMGGYGMGGHGMGGPLGQSMGGGSKMSKKSKESRKVWPSYCCCGRRRIHGR